MCHIQQDNREGSTNDTMHNNKPKWFLAVITIKSVWHEFCIHFPHKDFFFPTVSKHNTSKGKRRQLVQCSCKFTQHIWICNMLRHSSTLAWKIPWMEEPGRLQSMGSRRVGHDWATSLHFSLSCIGEGNGNPLQCSCLRIPGTGEPGGLPSMGSHRVGHDWSDLAATAAAAADTHACILA